MEKIATTDLRNNLYKIMDNIVLTGVPKIIERKGHRLKIALDDNKIDKFKHLKEHNSIIGNPEDLINIKLYKWEEGKNL